MLNLDHIVKLEDKSLGLEEKCRTQWGINERILPILKLVYFQGWKISKAAKSHGYNGSYVATVIRKLKAEGYEHDIRQTLRDYSKEAIESIEQAFWDSLGDSIKSGNVRAMELYAQIKGLVKEQPPETNVSIEMFKEFLEKD